MLIGISILFSFIVVSLLIAIFPLRVDKKPLYKITAISALIILLAAFSAYYLTWWYGIIVFVGLLFALSILVGKKIDWLKPVDQTEEEIIHRPFPLEFKEEGKGHSIFDDEFQQVMEKDFLSKRLHNQRSENQKEPVQPVAMLITNDAHELEQEEYLNKMMDASNEEEDSEFMLEFDQEIADERIELIDSDTSLIELEQATNFGKTNGQPTMSLEVEELSDEWLKTRLDALYGEDEAATLEDEGYAEDVPYTIEPFVTDLDSTSGFTLDEVSTTVDEVEFEDLSQLYYNEQRGENDGTA